MLDEDEGVGSDGNHMDDDLDADGSVEDVEEDDEDGDSITLQTKASPATASLTSASAKRQHAMEDGVNGVSKKRRKKTSNSVADDGDLIMVDAVPSPPLTKEIAITNGRSVGTQIEEPVEILGPDMVIVEDGCKGICAWNPVHPFLATASMGSGALIWNVPEEATSAEALERIELSHEPSRKSTDKAESTDKADVTAIRWSPEGTQLASGSYNGQTRIWSVDGRLKHAMWLHFAPPTSLKWNKTAKVLLALSCDGKMIAWDTTNGETIRMFDMGKEVMTEIEWISATQFIACGDNGNIHQFDIGVDGPIHSRTAHQGEVSCIAWDEATETVATGGADASVLVCTLIILCLRTMEWVDNLLNLDLAPAQQRVEARKQTPRAYGSCCFGCLATRRRIRSGIAQTNIGFRIERLHCSHMGGGFSVLPSRSLSAHRSHRAYLFLAQWDSAGVRSGRGRLGLEG